jgi:hypothetical protein
MIWAALQNELKFGRPNDERTNGFFRLNNNNPITYIKINK